MPGPLPVPITISPSQQAVKDRLLRQHSAPQALVRHHYEQLNQQQLDAAVAVFAANTKVHGFAPAPRSFAAYRQVLGVFFTAFPDALISIAEMVAEGDKVAVHIIFQGTQLGAFQGIAPTGKQVTVSGIAIFAFTGGKVSEGWLTLDNLGLLQQVDVIPTPG